MILRALIFIVFYILIGMLCGAVVAYAFVPLEDDGKEDNVLAFMTLTIIAWPGIIIVSAIGYLAYIIYRGVKSDYYYDEEDEDEFETDEERDS